MRCGNSYLSKDEEVMPVKMHGMSDEEVVVDDDADGSVAAEVVDVPLLLALSAVVQTNLGWENNYEPGRKGKRYCPLQRAGRLDDHSSHETTVGSYTTHWSLYCSDRM